MRTHPTALAAKVAAVNAAHRAANNLRPQLVALFTPYVGQKILTADGKLLAKIPPPELPYTTALYAFRSSSSYSLAWTVKACESSGDVAHYYEAGVYVGDLDGQNLKSLYPDTAPLRTDFTVEEVEAKRKIARDARKAYEDARSDCHPFGE